MEISEFSVKKRLMSKAALTKTPISGIFELTPRCNFNCKMCYIHMNKEQMKPFGEEKSAKEWIEFGKVCAEKGMLFLLLTGGEPFLRPDFKKIYSSLRNIGLCISINTNGSLISDDDIEFLSLNRPEAINITLYGASNETYKNLCGVDGVYDRVIGNIKKLKEKDIPVRLNVSLTRENIKDLEAIVAFGKENDIIVKITSYMFRPLRKEDGCHDIDSVVFSEEESGYARFLTTKYLMEEEEFNRIRENIRQGDYSIGVHGDECESQGENMSCMAGRSSFWVTWNGRMLPCGMINSPCAEPFAGGFKKAWEYITGEIAKVRLPYECSVCKSKNLCNPCAAITMSENGDFSKKPQYLCRSTQAYIDYLKSDIG